MADDSVYDPVRWRKLQDMAMPEPNSGCLLWLHAVNYDGYGLVGRGPGIPGCEGAHRASWKANFGPIPPGKHVCHKCDVRSCIEPTHFFLGTHAENMADRNRKGRCGAGAKPGAENPAAILSEADVRAIRVAAKSAMTQRAIAKRFGVHFQTVNDILRGRTWAHLE